MCMIMYNINLDALDQVRIYEAKIQKAKSFVCFGSEKTEKRLVTYSLKSQNTFNLGFEAVHENPI